MIKTNGTHKGTDYRLEELAGGRTKVIRRSPFSGKLHEQEFSEPIHKFMSYYAGEALIQDAFPSIDADGREFIMTGITAKEWNGTFGE